MNNKSLAARLLAFGLAFATFAATAQTLPPPQNVLQLSAAGTVDVTQDLLVVSLTTTRDGPDAATVQSQLKAALDAALTEARKAAQPGQLDVRTGNFGLSPRYAPLGKINGWQGTAATAYQTWASHQQTALGGLASAAETMASIRYVSRT